MPRHGIGVNEYWLRLLRHWFQHYYATPLPLYVITRRHVTLNVGVNGGVLARAVGLVSGLLARSPGIMSLVIVTFVKANTAFTPRRRHIEEGERLFTEYWRH